MYTGDMKLFSKKSFPQPNAGMYGDSDSFYSGVTLTHTETMRFNNSGMFDRQERNLSDYVWNVIKNPNSVSYSTWGDL